MRVFLAGTRRAVVFSIATLALGAIFGCGGGNMTIKSTTQPSTPPASPIAITSSPILITSGGTYTGNWVSDDPNTAAVTVSTSDPVVIQNSTIVSKGDLIDVVGAGTGAGANVTIHNVNGTALDPGINGYRRGMFLSAYMASAITVTHCTMVGVSFGIYIQDSTLATLTISNNAATNMEDRASNGEGGFTSQIPDLGHFVQLDHSIATNGGDISWNQVINTPGQSSVEDVLNIFLSRGTSNKTQIRIHDNYFQGMSSPASVNNDYFGSGIMMDGASNDLQTATGFVAIYNNQIVHTANAGIGIAAGHDISASNNSVVSCGKDMSGSWIATTYAMGIFIWNEYNSNVFFNNSVSGTTGGLVRPDNSGGPEIADAWGDTDLDTTENLDMGINFFTDPCMVDDDATLTPESEAYTQWIAKLAAASVTIGDQMN